VRADAVDAVLQDLERSARAVRADDGTTAGHRLDERTRQPFPDRREHEDPRASHVRQRVVHEARETHVGTDAELGDLALEMSASSGPLRGPQQDQPRRSLGSHPHEGANQRGEVLLRHEATNAEYDRRLSRCEPRVVEGLLDTP
jgi:hypothetical protein